MRLKLANNPKIHVYGTSNHIEVSLPGKATRVAAGCVHGSPLLLSCTLLGCLFGSFAWLLRTFWQFRQYSIIALSTKKASEHCSPIFNYNHPHNEHNSKAKQSDFFISCWLKVSKVFKSVNNQGLDDSLN